ncbi:Dynein light chain cytoplasmic [Penicillium frequentans]|uniref:Dynein light chain n=1 Tax=Penicillium frequentans TaxID=3151616 RepID=A0AAD6D0Z4_9EURO|nr:Dynein light chain cytoplasmic [Penicillium glabrum]
MSNRGESGQPYRRRALFDCAAALSNYSLVFTTTTRLPLNQPPLKILSLAIMTTEKKEKMEAQVKSVDMTEDMQREAIDLAIEAMEKYHVEKDIAQYIKKEFDSRKGATWHCVVGRNFGSFVTHETKHFIYFYLGHCAILLFKTQ